MPVVDVSVLSATDVMGVSPKKRFCVYVRLQGQAIRTKPTGVDRNGEIYFGERFRFQYQPDARRPGRNRMFVELWTKSLFSQACVSVAWIEMDEQNFQRGQQSRINVRGTFENKSAVISLAVTPLDFGNVPGISQPPTQSQQGMPGQMQYAPPLGYPNAPGQLPYQMQRQPQLQPGMYANPPAEGVPLAQESPYSTSTYMPNAVPVVRDAGNACEAARLPPQPDAYVGAALPPPLYPGLTRGGASAGMEQLFPEALPVSDQSPKPDYGDDYPKKPTQF
ncbi:hypothetical protein ABB37_08533 [Leptomonas pyrrhocoris]|uniref:C2 domain-containing protein n=1 Tax=Leptomonas pyrrhocoris TaxID=157538 RepID=A0A0N0DRV6_LEPPY|nr:hypothetical protein ABB37_08533 [Leptomonas pyrrhocoris]KPA75218.1 hypothetical protein ABB37_08533 [Leptomonas pyrrhocoris]|eukprot:XP_015653657.1 hypothetical protein ABB37_08533 [Leptomonas pyrrhocoris]